jgi:hypothetical protein
MFLCIIDSNNIIADPKVIAQQVIAPATVGAPLEGVDFLFLDVVGFHNPAERLHIPLCTPLAISMSKSYKFQ